MKYLIIEDEPLAAERLKEKIESLKPNWQCEAIIPTTASLKKHLPQSKAQFAFVDIHLGDGHSLPVLHELQIEIPLIFTTAYDQYALEAFKLNSLDYLLKPISTDELERALEKIEKATRLETKAPDWEALNALLKPRYKERFLVGTGERLITLNTQSIAYFFASGKHCFATDFNGKEFLVEYSLKDLLPRLNPESFFQINRQFIVNLAFIEEMHPYSKSRVKIILKVPQPPEAIVSVERAGKFKAWLQGEI